MKYLELFFDSIHGTINWTYRSIVFDVPWFRNYFWGLIIISLVVFFAGQRLFFEFESGITWTFFKNNDGRLVE